MVGFAFVGAVAAIAIFVIVLVGLYRWTDLYKGPFAALTAVSTVTGLLAAVMFVLAFRRKPPNPSSAGVDRHAAALPRAPPVPLARLVPAALSAALPSLPWNASVSDVLTRRFSTRLAGASDEAIDAAVHLMRTGSRSVSYGALAVVAPVGVMLGRRR